jgi:carboxyl-terminal processing protease
LLDYIEPKGEIVQIYKKDGTLLQSYKSDSRELDMPLAVLCNENTASAAELMTRSLMDTGKAESYGIKTFGKGCGQSGYQLSNGSVVYVTSFYYKTPESDNYDGIGITPDHVVYYPEGVNSINLFVQDHEDDLQLQAALTGLYKSIIGD